MRLAACLIGIVGGILGILTGMYEWSGAVTQIAGSSSDHTVWLFSVITMVMSIVGGVGAAFVWKSPRVTAWLSFVAVIGGGVGALVLWELAGSFFFITGVLASTMRSAASNQPAV
ncbi:hypothetical protein LSG31_18420 [Fodinisporobacter ferrooxydans]|uniref:DUF4064 domain-containing protein n=1 Tax=Fodinisporobacter ferrooxydans TaxID=2901836 RepID=A0ABY4CKQ4_9BACL|nr:hypothetical protein LSG31_18420 [Alicyclobacillaceae bacterium MYW30-H2]